MCYPFRNNNKWYSLTSSLMRFSYIDCTLLEIDSTNLFFKIPNNEDVQHLFLALFFKCLTF